MAEFTRPTGRDIEITITGLVTAIGMPLVMATGQHRAITAETLILEQRQPLASPAQSSAVHCRNALRHAHMWEGTAIGTLAVSRSIPA